MQNRRDVDTLRFPEKADLASLKSDVDELDINKLKIVPSGLNNLKSKADKLDVDKLKTVPITFKKAYVVNKGVFKKWKYKILTKN